MRLARFSLPLVFFFSPALLLAQEAKKLKYIPAVQELKRHELAINKLRKEQAAELKLLAGKQAVELQQVRERTVKALKEHQKKATLASRLDDALAIRSAIKELDQPVKKEYGIPAVAASLKGHRYLGVHINNVTWDQARQLCEKMGGHLAIIDNARELDFLKRLVGKHNLWVGAAKIRGKWRWIDGSTIAKGLWHDGGPRTDGAHHFVYISSKGDVWNTASPHENVPGFVCEWDR